ncbi:hypothetical protein DIE18_03050 [Burkholderia sp. Bp9125]|nr:hypothetical protein DIE18_03050 [Burkholderia sp. Bp9125]
MFVPAELTKMGREKLLAAQLPTDFFEWFDLVEKQVKGYARRREYMVHWQQGRTPQEAIELVAADRVAEVIVREVATRCNEEYVKINPKHFKFGSAYIAERVAYLLQLCI